MLLVGLGGRIGNDITRFEGLDVVHLALMLLGEVASGNPAKTLAAEGADDGAEEEVRNVA